MAIISEDYVSFETAKLLKEKGFNSKCIAYYLVFNENIKFYECNNLGQSLPYVSNDAWKTILRNPLESGYAAPTLQMAMKWLREVHNIMVSPYALSLGYYFEIFDLTNRDITGCKPLYKVGIPYKEDVLSTYEQACEEAIKYCLENLI